MKTIVYEGNRPGKKRKPGDVGYDLQVKEDTVIMHGERTIVTTGTKVALPYETEMQVRPRSGFSAKGMEGIPLKLIGKKQWRDMDGCYHVEHIYNPLCDDTMRYDADVMIGTVDPDYPDEAGAIVNSHDTHSFLVPKGTRISQGIFNDVVIPHLVEGEVKKNNNRNGGYGTSGI